MMYSKSATGEMIYPVVLLFFRVRVCVYRVRVPRVRVCACWAAFFLWFS